MNRVHLVYLILIGIGAGFVQRVSGFGLGIFSMVFMPHFLPAQAAATISCLHSCVTSTYNAVCYRKSIVYQTALPMLCAALVTIPVAVQFSNAVAADAFHILLGAVLIALSLYFLLFQKKIHIRPNLRNGILAGALGGTLNGLFSTGGPPVVLYLSCATADKHVYFATIQFYFAFTNLYATGMRALNQMVNGQILIYAGVGLVGCLLGDYLGRCVFDRLDSSKVKQIIYIGMIISGLLMLF